MVDPVTATLRDEAIAASKNAPELVAKLKVVDPALAQRMEGVSAAGSKTVWGPLGSAVVAWLGVRYAVPLDPATANLVSGLVAAGVGWLVSQVMHFIPHAPVTSVLPPAPIG